MSNEMIILCCIPACIMWYITGYVIGIQKSNEKIKTLKKIMSIDDELYKSTQREILLLKLMISTGYAELDVCKKSNYITKDYEAGMKLAEEESKSTTDKTDTE